MLSSIVLQNAPPWGIGRLRDTCRRCLTDVGCTTLTSSKSRVWSITRIIWPSVVNQVELGRL